MNIIILIAPQPNIAIAIVFGPTFGRARLLVLLLEGKVADIALIPTNCSLFNSAL